LERQQESPLERTVKAVTLILNKLSPTNFDKLSQEFVGLLGLGQGQGQAQVSFDPDVTKRIVELIVDKAQLEEKFCFIYAKLCKLCADLSKLAGPSNGAGVGLLAAASSESLSVGLAAADDAAAEAVAEAPAAALATDYRTVLLTNCRQIFSEKRSDKIDEILAVSVVLY
jgi:hypothetical protein